MIDVSIVDSFDSLELKAEQVLKGDLRMAMSKRIGGPSYSVDISKLFIHPVHSNRVLIEDIIIVADGLIIFNPAAIHNVDLAIFKHFLNGCFLFIR